MNFSYPSGIHSNDQPRDLLPGLEHIDLRDSDNDLGGSPIGDLVGAVRRRALPLGIWVACCLAAGIGYVAVARPEFVASAQMALEPRLRLPSGSDAAAVAAAAVPVLDSAQAESQLQVIRSAHNLRYVFDTLKLESDPSFADKGPSLMGRILGGVLGLLLPAAPQSDPEERATRARELAFQNFSDRVQVRRLGQSYVLEVSFRGFNPIRTAQITNSIAAAYIRDQVLVHAVSETRGTEFLQGRITLIQAEKKAADEAVATGVIPDFQFPDSDARIVGAAMTPLGATFPQTKLILLLSLLSGLVTGVAAIAVLHNFDRTVRSPAQIRRLLGVDCLVSIPRLKPGRLTDTTALTQPQTDFALSLRLLRTVLFAAGMRSHHVSIGFVGCQVGEGCSLLSGNLAHLVAMSGTRLTLIDANLQKPDLTRRLAPRATAGLDSLVLSSTEDADLPTITQTPSLEFAPAVSASAAGHKANPNAFLGSPAMRSALSRVSNRHDVIIDLPALDSSSDAQAIGNMLSGVVLVVALNRTKLDQVAEAVRALGSAGTRVLGIVLNDPPPSRRAASPGRISDLFRRRLQS